MVNTVHPGGAADWCPAERGKLPSWVNCVYHALQGINQLPSWVNCVYHALQGINQLPSWVNCVYRALQGINQLALLGEPPGWTVFTALCRASISWPSWVNCVYRALQGINQLALLGELCLPRSAGHQSAGPPGWTVFTRSARHQSAGPPGWTVFTALCRASISWPSWVNCVYRALQGINQLALLGELCLPRSAGHQSAGPPGWTVFTALCRASISWPSWVNCVYRALQGINQLALLGELCLPRSARHQSAGPPGWTVFTALCRASISWPSWVNCQRSAHRLALLGELCLHQSAGPPGWTVFTALCKASISWPSWVNCVYRALQGINQLALLGELCLPRSARHQSAGPPGWTLFTALCRASISWPSWVNCVYRALQGINQLALLGELCLPRSAGHQSAGPPGWTVFTALCRASISWPSWVNCVYRALQGIDQLALLGELCLPRSAGHQSAGPPGWTVFTALCKASIGWPLLGELCLPRSAGHQSAGPPGWTLFTALCRASISWPSWVNCVYRALQGINQLALLGELCLPRSAGHQSAGPPGWTVFTALCKDRSAGPPGWTVFTALCRASISWPSWVNCVYRALQGINQLALLGELCLPRSAGHQSAGPPGWTVFTALCRASISWPSWVNCVYRALQGINQLALLGELCLPRSAGHQSAGPPGWTVFTALCRASLALLGDQLALLGELCLPRSARHQSAGPPGWTVFTALCRASISWPSWVNCVYRALQGIDQATPRSASISWPSWVNCVYRALQGINQLALLGELCLPRSAGHQSAGPPGWTVVYRALQGINQLPLLGELCLPRSAGHQSAGPPGWTVFTALCRASISWPSWVNSVYRALQGINQLAPPGWTVFTALCRASISWPSWVNCVYSWPSWVNCVYSAGHQSAGPPGWTVFTALCKASISWPSWVNCLPRSAGHQSAGPPGWTVFTALCRASISWPSWVNCVYRALQGINQLPLLGELCLPRSAGHQSAALLGELCLPRSAGHQSAALLGELCLPRSAGHQSAGPPGWTVFTALCRASISWPSWVNCVYGALQGINQLALLGELCLPRSARHQSAGPPGWTVFTALCRASISCPSWVNCVYRALQGINQLALLGELCLPRSAGHQSAGPPGWTVFTALCKASISWPSWVNCVYRALQGINQLDLLGELCLRRSARHRSAGPPGWTVFTALCRASISWPSWVNCVYRALQGINQLALLGELCLPRSAGHQSAGPPGWTVFTALCRASISWPSWVNCVYRALQGINQLPLLGELCLRTLCKASISWPSGVNSVYRALQGINQLALLGELCLPRSAGHQSAGPPGCSATQLALTGAELCLRLQGINQLALLGELCLPRSAGHQSAGPPGWTVFTALCRASISWPSWVNCVYRALQGINQLALLGELCLPRSASISWPSWVNCVYRALQGINQLALLGELCLPRSAGHQSAGPLGELCLPRSAGHQSAGPPGWTVFTALCRASLSWPSWVNCVYRALQGINQLALLGELCLPRSAGHQSAGPPGWTVFTALCRASISWPSWVNCVYRALQGINQLALLGELCLPRSAGHQSAGPPGWTVFTALCRASISWPSWVNSVYRALQGINQLALLGELCLPRSAGHQSAALLGELCLPRSAGHQSAALLGELCLPRSAGHQSAGPPGWTVFTALCRASISWPSWVNCVYGALQGINQLALLGELCLPRSAGHQSAGPPGWTVFTALCRASISCPSWVNCVYRALQGINQLALLGELCLPRSAGHQSAGPPGWTVFTALCKASISWPSWVNCVYRALQGINQLDLLGELCLRRSARHRSAGPPGWTVFKASISWPSWVNCVYRALQGIDQLALLGELCLPRSAGHQSAGPPGWTVFTALCRASISWPSWVNCVYRALQGINQLALLGELCLPRSAGHQSAGPPGWTVFTALCRASISWPSWVNCVYRALQGINQLALLGELCLPRSARHRSAGLLGELCLPRSARHQSAGPPGWTVFTAARHQSAGLLGELCLPRSAGHQSAGPPGWTVFTALCRASISWPSWVNCVYRALQGINQLALLGELCLPRSAGHQSAGPPGWTVFTALCRASISWPSWVNCVYRALQGINQLALLGELCLPRSAGHQSAGPPGWTVFTALCRASISWPSWVNCVYRALQGINQLALLGELCLPRSAGHQSAGPPGWTVFTALCRASISWTSWVNCVYRALQGINQLALLGELCLPRSAGHQSAGPPGWTVFTTLCRASISCPPGWTVFTTLCRASISCPPGWTVFTTLCRASISWTSWVNCVYRALQGINQLALLGELCLWRSARHQSAGPPGWTVFTALCKASISWPSWVNCVYRALQGINQLPLLGELCLPRSAGHQSAGPPGWTVFTTLCRASISWPSWVNCVYGALQGINQLALLGELCLPRSAGHQSAGPPGWTVFTALCKASIGWPSWVNCVYRALQGIDQLALLGELCLPRSARHQSAGPPGWTLFTALCRASISCPPGWTVFTALCRASISWPSWVNSPRSAGHQLALLGELCLPRSAGHQSAGPPGWTVFTALCRASISWPSWVNCVYRALQGINQLALLGELCLPRSAGHQSAGPPGWTVFTALCRASISWPSWVNCVYRALQGINQLALLGELCLPRSAIISWPSWVNCVYRALQGINQLPLLGELCLPRSAGHQSAAPPGWTVFTALCRASISWPSWVNSVYRALQGINQLALLGELCLPALCRASISWPSWVNCVYRALQGINQLALLGELCLPRSAGHQSAGPPGWTVFTALCRASISWPSWVNCVYRALQGINQLPLLGELCLPRSAGHQSAALLGELCLPRSAGHQSAALLGELCLPRSAGHQSAGPPGWTVFTALCRASISWPSWVNCVYGALQGINQLALLGELCLPRSARHQSAGPPPGCCPSWVNCVYRALQGINQLALLGELCLPRSAGHQSAGPPGWTVFTALCKASISWPSWVNCVYRALQGINQLALLGELCLPRSAGHRSAGPPGWTVFTALCRASISWPSWVNCVYRALQGINQLALLGELCLPRSAGHQSAGPPGWTVFTALCRASISCCVYRALGELCLPRSASISWPSWVNCVYRALQGINQLALLGELCLPRSAGHQSAGPPGWTVFTALCRASISWPSWVNCVYRALQGINQLALLGELCLPRSAGHQSAGPPGWTVFTALCRAQSALNRVHPGGAADWCPAERGKQSSARRGSWLMPCRAR